MVIKDDLRKYSSQVVDGVERAPGRSMLRAVGFTDEDFKKPQIGIASTWAMVTPCNMHIDKLAIEDGLASRAIKPGVESEDAAEGVRSFIEKRPAQFTGR